MRLKTGRGPRKRCKCPKGSEKWREDASKTAAIASSENHQPCSTNKSELFRTSLTATAIVASMGAPTAFKDAREFAAWVGLVSRQTGTGGRMRQLGISKRGDAYLRTLLMHGARAVVIRSKDGPT